MRRWCRRTLGPGSVRRVLCRVLRCRLPAHMYHWYNCRACLHLQPGMGFGEVAAASDPAVPQSDSIALPPWSASAPLCDAPSFLRNDVPWTTANLLLLVLPSLPELLLVLPMLLTPSSSPWQ